MTTLTSTELEVDSYEEAVELCHRNGWTDGLPVVPPTPEKVERFLEVVQRAPDEVLGFYRERSRSVTVEKIAINAVMAGCLPEYFPVVLAIAETLVGGPYNWHALNASTGSAQLGFIINGPIRDQIGMNYRGNFMGPGNRANSTIGRAIRLIQINAFGSVPGAGHDETYPLPVLDRSTMGHGAKYAGYHIPEFEEAIPYWLPLHVERGYAGEQNVLHVFTTGGGMQMSTHADKTAEQISDTVAHRLAHLGRHLARRSEGSWIVLVITPEAATIVARDGWSKAQFREAVFEKSKRSVAWLKQNGWPATGLGSPLAGVTDNTPVAPGDETTLLSVAGHPDDLYLAVAGGPAGSWVYFWIPYGGAIAVKPF
jgi:hypothetical protein